MAGWLIGWMARWLAAWLAEWLSDVGITSVKWYAVAMGVGRDPDI